MAELFLPRSKGPFKQKSWERIEKEYYNLVSQGWDQQPMLNLVQHIQYRGMHHILTATTFDATLIITIISKEIINPYKVALHLIYDTVDKVWHFIYYGSKKRWLLPAKPQFNKVYNTEDGIHFFEDFIKKMRWVKT